MRILTILAAGVALSAVPAAAQDTTLWKKVGDWEISIDPTIRNGCYAVATWNGGTVLRIGLNPEEDNFYFLIGNDAWASLQANQPYDIEIQFDNRAPWEVSAQGLQFNPGETVYLHAESTKFEFIEEFMRLTRMKISYQGEEIDQLRLTGSSRAFKEVMACQEEMKTREPEPGTDPFAPSAGAAKSGKAAASGG